MTRYAVGVDGGGSGTRVVVADDGGAVLARASAGPSALGLGVELAWQEIGRAVAQAFATAGRAFDWSACTLCCGLSGVNNASWRDAFEQATPPGASMLLVSDAYTTLWGAHGGRPGVIVALGTGSIAAALVSVPAAKAEASPDEMARATTGAKADATTDAATGAKVGATTGAKVGATTDATAVLEERISGGYGFPSGDEASGAWLGLRAVVYLQQVMDGRRAADDFSAALREQIRVKTRDALVEWSCDANQTAYATLAPIVIAFGTHPFAAALLSQAGNEIARMVDALDPEGLMPIALCGGLAAPLAPFVPERFVPRMREPEADSVGGALALALDRMRQAG